MRHYRMSILTHTCWCGTHLVIHTAWLRRLPFAALYPVSNQKVARIRRRAHLHTRIYHIQDTTSGNRCEEGLCTNKQHCQIQNQGCGIYSLKIQMCISSTYQPRTYSYCLSHCLPQQNSKWQVYSSNPQRRKTSNSLYLLFAIAVPHNLQKDDVLAWRK